MVRLVLASAALAAAVGCSSKNGDDEIRTYAVPKAAAVEAAAPKEDYRILAAVFPADQPAWFFKLAGRGDDLAPHVAGFEALLKTVRFPNGPKNAPNFEPPLGWTLGGPNPDKMADETIKLPGGKYEVTLTRAGGDLGENIARWTGQLGKKMDAAAAKALAKPVQGQTGLGWFVDLKGPKNPTARGGPMMGR